MKESRGLLFSTTTAQVKKFGGLALGRGALTRKFVDVINSDWCVVLGPKALKIVADCKRRIFLCTNSIMNVLARSARAAIKPMRMGMSTILYS
jgi:hypothetical protein